MIRFNLLDLLDKLKAEKGQKFTLKQVSELSGCDKNALSRMVNHPEIIPSANVIDKLVQFFFFNLTRDEQKPQLDKNRMKMAIKDFITVYPDRENEGFWSVVPSDIRDKANIDVLWSFYCNAHPIQRERSSDAKKSLKKKLEDAAKNRVENAEIELSLTREEFELICSQFGVKS